jgi:hypothetical protein
MIVPKHSVLEHTNHRVVAIVLGLKGRGPPRLCHGGVEVIPGDRASSIRVIAKGRSSMSSGLISVDIRLKFRAIRNVCCRKKTSGSYSGIRLCIVGWHHPRGKARSNIVGLMRSQSESAMSIQLTTGKNGPSQLCDVMGILSPSFDSESTDTVCRLVVCMLAASCRTMKTF